MTATATPRPSPTPEPTPAPACIAPELPGSGRRCYAAAAGDPFVHPIALDIAGKIAYLLDGGRVLALALDRPVPPILLLAPGSDIDGRRVLEPLDLAVAPGGLAVLDRAGDIYFYEHAAGRWTVERPDRAIDDTSSHYYVALAAAAQSRFLLETSYSYGLRYRPDLNPLEEFGWPIPTANFADLVVDRADQVSTAFVLDRPPASQVAGITRYVQGEPDRRFKARVEISHPRALLLAGERLYLLDQAGRRLTAMGATSGLVEAEWQFPFSLSTLAAMDDRDGGIVLAGRNALYFLDQPADTAVIPAGDIALSSPQPHDPNVLQLLPPLIRPIENLAPASQDLRLPGAPRHYRFGIHEGVDFYWGPGREVRATADGTIIRATIDYVDPGPAQFAAWRERVRELGYSSPEALDFFRGRQIWIEHASGVISRYAHLSAIDPAVQVGMTVAQGQIIGLVGNSGSPASLDSDSADAHLHFELRVGDYYLGQFLRPIETRELFETLFTD